MTLLVNVTWFPDPDATRVVGGAAELAALEAARTRYSRERGERTASPNRLGVNSQESAG